MKQVKVNNVLYVIDTEAYQITQDTDAGIIFVPEDSYADYVELNPDLTLTKYNYNMFRVTTPEWDVPEPPTPPIPSDPRLIGIYNVEDVGEESYPTKIYPYMDSPQNSVHGVDLFDKIEIDNVEVSVESLDENGGQYQFETTGEHTVKFTLKNPSVLPPFFNCNELVELVIPESITSIGQGAFYQSNLERITLPDTLTSIGQMAFYQAKLTTINIPNSVTSIGQTAFAYNSQLTSVTIGNSVTTMGERVFDGCTSLASVIVNCPTIGKEAFENCSALTSVTFGNGVINIGQEAFHKCSGLTSISLPDSVTEIGQYAFQTCSNLSELTFGNSISNIDVYAFSECTSLTSVNIPNTITNIGDSAFGDCSSLISITINATTPPTIGISFTNNAEGRKIYVPASSVDTYKTASTNWRGYASYISAIEE